MNALSSLAREFGSYLKLITREPGTPPLVFYAEDPFTYVQFEGYLREWRETLGRPVTYLTSAADDPLLRTSPAGMETLYLKKLAANYLAMCRARVLALTMPEVGRPGFPRPPASTVCAYVFHSLNSTHSSYRTGAFDHYDVFFCTGEHHTRELTARFQQLGRPVPRLEPVGYSKLDRIHRDHQTYRPRHPEATQVLVAPSWHPQNLLEEQGLDLTERLLAEGFRVVVRPHPCFFQPIYPRGREVVAALEARFGGHPQFVLEKSIQTEDSFHEAAVMICDWSGAAAEYALGTGRPVLFLDTPQKQMNPDWRELGLPAFEERIRRDIGVVVPPGAQAEVPLRVRELLAAAGDWHDRLAELRTRLVYNFGKSDEVGARLLAELAG